MQMMEEEKEDDEDMGGSLVPKEAVDSDAVHTNLFQLKKFNFK